MLALYDYCCLEKVHTTRCRWKELNVSDERSGLERVSNSCGRCMERVRTEDEITAMYL